MKNAIRTLGVTGICLSGALGFAHNSFGEENTVSLDKFELQVFETTLASGELVSGDLSAAVENLLVAKTRRAEYSINTNLCVAYTAQGEFERAEAHCQLAKRLSTTRSDGPRWTGMSTREKRALALNNLGVLKALQGNTEEALEYFAGAGSKSRKFMAIADRNMDALKQRTGPAVTASS